MSVSGSEVRHCQFSKILSLFLFSFLPFRHSIANKGLSVHYVSSIPYIPKLGAALTAKKAIRIILRSERLAIVSSVRM